MTVYCIDTSSLIAAWQERYPIENFPKFWERMELLSAKERLVSPLDVLNEIQKRSDELHKWLKVQAGMFIELDDATQIEAAKVLAAFPRLVGEKKLRTSADPFVIALARVKGLQIVTEEKPTGHNARPNIPDVCLGMGMKSQSACWTSSEPRRGSSGNKFPVPANRRISPRPSGTKIPSRRLTPPHPS